jgi:hypothetical protein
MAVAKRIRFGFMVCGGAGASARPDRRAKPPGVPG